MEINETKEVIISVPIPGSSLLGNQNELKFPGTAQCSMPSQ